MSRSTGILGWSFGVCAIAVLTLALIPTLPYRPTTGWDKTNHVLAFAALAWLGGRAFAPKVARVLLGLVFFGAPIEVLQSFTPTRTVDWFDLLADGMGVVTGWVLMRLQGRAPEKPLPPLSVK